MVTAVTILMIPVIVPVALCVIVGAGMYQTANKGAKAAKRRFSASKEKEKGSVEVTAGERPGKIQRAQSA
jgi:uncharacterized ion transporter superfamily protein YfcC